MRILSRLPGLLLLLLAAVPAVALEIVIESYAQGLDLCVFVPYNTVLFKQRADGADMQLALELRKDGRTTVASRDTAFTVPRRQWLENTALPYFARFSLPVGKYQVLLRLKNLDLGDKYDLKKVFSVSRDYTEIGQAYLVAEREGVSFVPSGEGDWGPVERCVLRQRFSLAADSVMVRAGDLGYSFIRPQQEYRVDLTEAANAGLPKGVEISLFEGNIRYNMGPFFFERWFSYNYRYTYKEQLQQLRYVANMNEWNSLRAVPEEHYTEAIERFWQGHDPSPGTLRNEAREEFYQRVIVADERYTIHKRLQGWKSDRGRIYIKFGDPDEVYSEVHPLDLYPYIVWIYYSRNLQFEFADTGGFGQYKLRNKDEEY